MQFQALPLRGSNSLSFQLVRENQINPFEGKRGGSGQERILTYTFNSDVFKSLLLDMQRGATSHKWGIPKGIPMEYVLQAGAEEKVDGVWRCKRGRSQNHLFDCETMQIVLAYLNRVYRNEFLTR